MTPRTDSTVPSRPAGEPLHLALVVSRFPKFTETFVVNEILALQRLGATVDIHPLLPPEPHPHQPAAVPLVERARFGSPWGVRSIGAFCRMAVARPRALAGIIVLLARRTWRRPAVLAKDLALLPRICAISRDVADDGVDHVHAHFATHAGFAAFCIHRLTGIPYSIVAHGSDIHRHQLMLSDKVAEAAFVATVSEFNRNVIVAACEPTDARRVEVVRIGIDLSNVGPAWPGGRRSASEAGQDPLIICAGTLHEVKGQEHLIRAVEQLDRSGRRVRLELIGNGEDLDRLQDLVTELGIGDRVSFAGSLNHDDVFRRYEAATLVVTPSVASSDGRKEGIPTVLIEAMASGVNVIASDLAGTAELVAHEVTGILTEPGNPTSIADAIARLLDDQALAARLRERARTRVLDEYAIDATAARMIELITADERVPASAGSQPTDGPTVDRDPTEIS